MPAHTAPGLSLRVGFTPGENGWGDEYNEDLLKLSVLVQLRVLSRTIFPPADDSNSSGVAPGDIYIVPEDDSNSMQDSNSTPMHNWIAAFDGESGFGQWHYFQPLAGFIAYVIDEDQHYRYTGSTWVAMGGDALNISYSSGDGGDSNSVMTNVAAALDDLYARVRDVSLGVVDASTVAYSSGDGGDSNSTATTVQEALDDLYGSVRVIEENVSGITFANITAGVTLTAADNKKFYRVLDDSNSPAFIDISIPEDALEDLPDGFTVSAVQIGGSQVRFVGIEDSNSPAAAVLVYPADMQPQSRGVGSVITALKTSEANEWIIFGDLEQV